MIVPLAALLQSVLCLPDKLLFRSNKESRVQSYENCIPATLIVPKETNKFIDFALKAKYLN
jgi:hypothetical protein